MKEICYRKKEKKKEEVLDSWFLTQRLSFSRLEKFLSFLASRNPKNKDGRHYFCIISLLIYLHCGYKNTQWHQHVEVGDQSDRVTGRERKRWENESWSFLDGHHSGEQTRTSATNLLNAPCKICHVMLCGAQRDKDTHTQTHNLLLFVFESSRGLILQVIVGKLRRKTTQTHTLACSRWQTELGRARMCHHLTSDLCFPESIGVSMSGPVNTSVSHS